MRLGNVHVHFLPLFPVRAACAHWQQSVLLGVGMPVPLRRHNTVDLSWSPGFILLCLLTEEERRSLLSPLLAGLGQ